MFIDSGGTGLRLLQSLSKSDLDHEQLAVCIALACMSAIFHFYDMNALAQRESVSSAGQVAYCLFFNSSVDIILP